MSDDAPDTHMPPQALRRGVDTQAYWSFKPTNRLLLLVHGFSGSPDETWRGLPQQLMLHDSASGFDLISFGYDSLALTADESANELHLFLDSLLNNTTNLVNRSIEQYDPAARRVGAWKYTHAIIAGHSLGACVVRRALLNQIKAGRAKWNLKSKLIWFAPAHGGARITDLATAVAGLVPGGWGELVLGVGKYRAPVLYDLERGSDFLEDLRDDTEKFSDQYGELNAAVTFWAPGDKVVFNRPFHKDAMPTVPVRGEDHISIAKFNGFDARLQKLLEQMKDFA